MKSKIINEFEIDCISCCSLRIFIPTLNRPKELVYNFELLVFNLNKINTNLKIQIIISENCSDFDKKNNVNKLEYIAAKYDKNDIELIFINRTKRLHIENHLGWVSSFANAEWVMWLGDDDILSFEYLDFIISNIEKKNKNIMGFNPGYGTITAKEFFSDHFNVGQENTLKVTKYSYSIINSFIIHRGHQLSGLAYRYTVIQEAQKYLTSFNMYVWMAYQIIALKKGEIIYLEGQHCKITSDTPKLFSYGKDGLFPEICESIMAGFHDNYKMGVYYTIKVLGGIGSWRIFMTSKNPFMVFFRFLALAANKKMDKLVFCGLTPLIFYRVVRLQVGKIKRAVMNQDV